MTFLDIKTSKNLLLSVLIALAIPVSTPIYADAPTKTRNPKAISSIDRVINEGQNQLTNIRICLNQISALVKKNPAYSQEKKDAAVEHLVSLDSMLIAGLKNEKFIQADLESAYLLLKINNALINHIHALITTDFKDIASFDIDNLITKAMTRKKGPLNPQDMLVRLVANNQKLDALKKKALGLTWYNKLVRQIDELIITPSQKHSIPSRTLLAATTTATVATFLWAFSPKLIAPKGYFDQKPITTPDKALLTKMVNDNTDDNSLNEQLKTLFFRKNKNKSDFDYNDKFEPKTYYEHFYHNIFGPPVNTDGGNNVSNTNELGLVGKLNSYAYRVRTGLLWVPVTLGALAAAGWTSEFKESIYPKITKWSDIAKNWLKGGNYLKEAERAAEKVDQVRFKEINGQDEIIRYMQLLVDYLEDPESFDRLGLTPPKGILCIGDTRTGKTFAISALFGEINEMLKRTGQTGKFKLIKLDVMSIKIEGMEKILRKVQHNAPCIVFIDEIDLLDLQRTGENRTLSEFLTSMSDVIASKDSKKQVIIIAATNRPETLDIALRQPGRFGKELRFEYPNYQDRYKFIKTKIEELSLTSDQFDIGKLARFTENKSYEALNMLIKNAIIKARLSNQLLDQSHLDQALDEDIYHIISKYTKQVPEHEMRILSAHFAGQAAAISLANGNIKLAKVTIKQVMTELKEEVMGIHLIEDKNRREQDRFEYGRIFTHHSSDSINMNSKKDKFALCRMYLAGFIAEEMLLGSCSYSCHAENDMASALKLAQSIAFEGLDISTMPKHIQKQKHDEALTIVEQCKKDTRALLESNKDLLVKLSDELLKQETLDQLQVDEIIASSAAPAA